MKAYSSVSGLLLATLKSTLRLRLPSTLTSAVEPSLSPLTVHSVSSEELAEPASDNLFQLANTWSINKDDLGSEGSVDVTDGNTMTVEFKVAPNDDANEKYAFIDATSIFAPGALRGVSHFDILYESDSPFRVRLIPENESDTSMQVLLAGTGGERVARVRIKDFRPDNYTDPNKIASAGFVDQAYLEKVIGISIEAAPTTGQRDFTVKIKRIVSHGLTPQASARVLAPAQRAKLARRIGAVRKNADVGLGSAAHWPRHAETHVD